MTVLEYMRNWLNNNSFVEGYARFTTTGDEGVLTEDEDQIIVNFNETTMENHFDYMDQKPTKNGLFSNGTTLLREDIEGNKKYVANLVLMSGLYAFQDYDRIMNSDYITRLTYSLSEIKNVEITEIVNGEAKAGIITGASGSNGMLYSIPTGDINDGVVYQIQIQVNYTIFA